MYAKMFLGQEAEICLQNFMLLKTNFVDCPWGLEYLQFFRLSELRPKMARFNFHFSRKELWLRAKPSFPSYQPVPIHAINKSKNN
jgi:hypothetical protein